MPKNFWWFVSLLTSILLIVLAAVYARQQQTELTKTRGEMEQLRLLAQETHSQAERLLTGLEESKERIQKLTLEKEESALAQRNLEAQMRAALESKDVTISELQGKLTVNILDRILFDSGEAAVKPEGQAVLDQIGKVLSNYPNRQIQVIGHTDNVPIRWRIGAPFQSNWELSAARAIAAVRYLSERAGVDPRRLGAVGYGEYHPIADNNTAEGRAKNRRIALVVAPEELLASDLMSATNAPVVATNAVTEAEQPEAAPDSSEKN
jgi:chemotaxis protein MotB